MTEIHGGALLCEEVDYDLCEFEWEASDRRLNSTSKRIRMAPIVMAESATLKAGQGLKVFQGRK